MAAAEENNDNNNREENADENIMNESQCNLIEDLSPAASLRVASAANSASVSVLEPPIVQVQA